MDHPVVKQTVTTLMAEFSIFSSLSE